MVLETSRFFISRDVIFHESRFSFATKSSSSPIFSEFNPSPEYFALKDPYLSTLPTSHDVDVFLPLLNPQLQFPRVDPVDIINLLAGPRIIHVPLSSPLVPLLALIPFPIILTTPDFLDPIKVFWQRFLHYCATFYHERIMDPRWKHAMDLELAALDSNRTWNAVDLPPNVKPIGCRWVYKLKFLPIGKVDKF